MQQLPVKANNPKDDKEAVEPAVLVITEAHLVTLVLVDHGEDHRRDDLAQGLLPSLKALVLVVENLNTVIPHPNQAVHDQDKEQCPQGIAKHSLPGRYP